MLQISKSKVENHLRKLGMVTRLDVLVSRKLSAKMSLTKCDMRLKRNENHCFLKQIGTGDEQWTVYNNVEIKRSWLKTL